VNIGQAPQGIWRKFKRRGYPKMALADFLKQRPEQALRMGSYGDPVAVPIYAWAGAGTAPKRAGYTHQWRHARAEPFRKLVMASCDSVADAAEAAQRGWRAFLVRQPGDVAELPGMVECANTTHGKSCATCALCFGSHPTAPSIWIEAHGTAKRFVGAL
jgi:hypothetical protein